MTYHDRRREELELLVSFVQGAMRAHPDPREGYTPLADLLREVLIYLRDMTPETCTFADVLELELKAEPLLTEAWLKGWDGWTGQRLFLPSSEYERWYRGEMIRQLRGEPVSREYAEEHARRQAEVKRMVEAT